MKGLEGVGVTFYEMKALKGKYRLSYEVIKSNNAYMKDLLPKTMYEIIGKPEVLKTVQNFNVLYKDTDKSSNMLKYFVSKFREEYAYKPSNITIVDDVRVIDLLDQKIVVLGRRLKKNLLRSIGLHIQPLMLLNLYGCTLIK